MAVPRVTMDKIGVDICSIEVRAASHGAKDRAQRFRAGEISGINFVTCDLEVTFLKALIAKATNLHLHHFRQFARKKTDVNSRAAVNVRRILVGKKKDFQARGRIKW